MAPSRMLWVSWLAFLVACNTDNDGANASGNTQVPGAHAAHKPLDDKPAAATNARGVFAYRAAGRRDPFRSYLLDASARQRAEHAQRHMEETESYELNQYRLTAVLTGTSQPKAMVEDPTGRAYVVRIGARLGRSGGRITRIDSRGLQVMEESLNPQGTRAQAATTLTLPVSDTDDSAPGLGATP